MLTAVLRALCNIDCFLLLVGYKLVIFCCEWLSIARRTIERSLIVLMVALLAAGALLEFMRHEPIWYVACVCHVWLAGVSAWCLVRSHRTPERDRAALLFYPPAIVTRPLICFLYIFFASIQLLPPLSARDICIAANYFLWPVAEYIMATGGGNDGMGRRRKAALGKLRQAFRMPVPSAAFTTLGNSVPSIYRSLV